MKTRGKIRIISGEWKRRKLSFSSSPDLRPSTDAVRETLFNWLAPGIKGAICLDLFAGSGALGFESVSRGADRVDMVETHLAAYRDLIKNNTLLGGGDSVKIYRRDAIRFLQSVKAKYDMVFLDPPFKKNILELVFTLLVEKDILKSQALIYVETGSDKLLSPFPPGWNIIRQSSVGKVNFLLIQS